MRPIDGQITNPGRVALGQYGSVPFTGAGAVALVAASPFGTSDLAFIAIHFLTDTVLSVLTSANSASSPAPSPTDLVFPAGDTIYGNFSAFTVTSGTGLAYQGPRL